MTIPYQCIDFVGKAIRTVHGSSNLEI